MAYFRNSQNLEKSPKELLKWSELKEIIIKTIWKKNMENLAFEQLKPKKVLKLKYDAK